MSINYTASALTYSHNLPTNTSCVNWNQYYTNCTQLGGNPFQGTISFDNIGMAWVAIFLVISLEGWTDIMYYVQDAHSFWDWIYFVLLIVVRYLYFFNTIKLDLISNYVVIESGKSNLTLKYFN